MQGMPRFTLRQAMLELTCIAVAVPGWLAWFNVERGARWGRGYASLILIAMFVGTFGAVGGLKGKTGLGALVGFIISAAMMAAVLIRNQLD